MCIMVYLSSGRQLPTIKWNNEAPDFYVTELKDTDDGYKEIRSILTQKYLYNIGAHTGCGCGFYYGVYQPFNAEDIQEDLKGRSSVNKLFQYIKANLKNHDSIELFTCLAGNEGVSPKKTYELCIDQINLGDCFYFESNNELRIIKR